MLNNFGTSRRLPVDVDRRAVPAGVHHFRCHVELGSTPFRKSAVMGVDFRSDAEVAHFDLLLGVDEDIGLK